MVIFHCYVSSPEGTQKWIKSGIFLTNNLNKLLTPMAMNQSLQTGRDPTFDGRSIELVSGIYKLPVFSHLSWLAWKSSSRSVGKESSMSPPNYDLDLPIWYSKGQHPWHRNNHYTISLSTTGFCTCGWLACFDWAWYVTKFHHLG